MEVFARNQKNQKYKWNIVRSFVSQFSDTPHPSTDAKSVKFFEECVAQSSPRFWGNVNNLNK